MAVDRINESSVSLRLRAEGFVPLPRLWVKAEAIPEIHVISSRYTSEVNRIRAEIHGGKGPAKPVNPIEQAKKDKEAAWAAYEKLRGR